MNNLGMVYRDTKRIEESINILEPAHDVGARSLGPNHSTAFAIADNLAQSYLATKQIDKGIAVLAPAFEHFRSQSNADGAIVRQVAQTLVQLYLAAGQDDLARDLADELGIAPNELIPQIEVDP